jgi:hypothetical protein
MSERLTTLSGKRILRFQTVGFSVLVLLSISNEVFSIPHYLLGEPKEFVWARLLSRLVVLLAIWALVHFTTRRLLKRLHELEEFLLICSWCRRVGNDGQWISVEQYFDTKFQTGTSHGICPDCAKRELDAHHQRAATRVAKSI